MSNFCSNCGKPIQGEVSFCPNCGIQLETTNSNSVLSENMGKTAEIPIEFSNGIRNKQSSIANKALLAGFVFLALAYLSFSDDNPLSGIWALGLISIFGIISSLVIFFIFRSRSKKMNSLLSGEKVIAAWQMSSALKAQYVNYLYEHENAKNRGIFFITGILIVVIFGIFIVFMDEGKAAMALVMLALIVLIGFFAFAMPHYYKNKNTQADGKVLIGKNFAYINGFFHNWDFPLSGIRKSAIINEPFHGLYIQYYYTDRTFNNTEELHIPAPGDVDLGCVLQELKH